MGSFADAVAEDAGGVILSLEVSPASRKAGFLTGYDPWRKTIRCAVGSPAREGRGNLELVESLAGFLGVPVTSVRIVSGATGSRKRVRVQGITRQAVLDRLGGLH